jgi:organic hydroperoxide reductase OsmC/OhrA
MSTHNATIAWRRREQDTFGKGHYSRAHEWRFDGGSVIAASAAPSVVPALWSDPAAVDPEEAVVAGAASCHMLWFLSLAAARGFEVERYEDAAEGRIGRLDDGRSGFVDIVLRPRIAFSGDLQPSADDLAALHEAADARCYVANSLRCPVRVEADPQAVASLEGRRLSPPDARS